MRWQWEWSDMVIRRNNPKVKPGTWWQIYHHQRIDFLKFSLGLVFFATLEESLSAASRRPFRPASLLPLWDHFQKCIAFSPHCIEQLTISAYSTNTAHRKPRTMFCSPASAPALLWVVTWDSVAILSDLKWGFRVTGTVITNDTNMYWKH